MVKFITILSLLISLVSGQEKKPPVSTYYEQKKSLFEVLPNSENEIIFLGNSITDGCEWSELFQDNRIKNRGISADQTAGVYARLDEVLSSFPLKIFLMIGVNDLAAGISEDSIMTNYRKIIHKIRSDSPETQIFVQSILPVNAAFIKFKNHTNKTTEILRLNQRILELCDKFEILYIDLYSHFETKEHQIDPKYTNDGLHLTGAGYLLWKSIIEDFVRD
jgi:lysophospholipase L1-like esterase